MIKINRKVEYALMVLHLMQERNESELTTAREVCDRFHTPFDTTAKVMQQMGSHGILESIKGVKGGYYLARDLQAVSYMELVELIEEKSFVMECSAEACELHGQCNITAPIRRLNDYLVAIFRSLSVKELLANGPLQMSDTSKGCPSFVKDVV